MIPSTAAEYERCKQTHRCARGYADYDTLNASHSFSSSVFALDPHNTSSANRSRVAALFADFEEWTIGTHGWTLASNFLTVPPNSTNSSSTAGPHFNTFDLPLQGHLRTSASDTVIFDTDELIMRIHRSNHTGFVNATNTTEQVNGSVGITAEGTEVAVFNFLSIRLGGRVVFQGNRALSLLSRTSAVVQTEVKVPPGTLGGFPGGADIGRYNINGQGSASSVVQLYTLHVDAAVVNAVQVVRTSARDGQTLQGSFVLAFRGEELYPVAADASAAEFKALLEDSAKIGKVAVTRSPRSSVGGFAWTVTFLSAIGEVPPLEVVEIRLGGEDATAQVDVLQSANFLGGSIRLAFGSEVTARIPFNATSDELRAELLHAFDVVTAEVRRTDPSSDRADARASGMGICDAGLCLDGPTRAMGFSWAITLVSTHNNISPTSPTSTDANASLAPIPLSIVENSLTAINATALVEPGHTLPHPSPPLYIDSAHNYTFTLAFGGEGGRRQPTTDLVGGSGGAVGGNVVSEILSHYPPAGVGGNGGGALEISAVNDIVLDPFARLLVEGDDGADAFHGGGGGAGGTLSLHALKGAVSINPSAEISVKSGSSGISFSGARTYAADDGMMTMSGNGVDIEVQSVLSEREDEHFSSTERVVRYALDRSRGAAGTSSSMRVTFPWDITQGKNRFSRGGPRYDISASPQPTRVSAFVMIGEGEVETDGGWHFLLALYEESEVNQTSGMVAIGVGGMEGEIRHGVQFRNIPKRKGGDMRSVEVWHKLDVLIDWNTHVYDVRLDDVSFVVAEPFTASKLHSLVLHVFNGAEVWFDEVFVGEDHQMGFRCPHIRGGQEEAHPEVRRQRHDLTPQRESFINQNERGEFEVMRHESHLSLRELYMYENISGMNYGSGARHLHSITELPAGDRQRNNNSHRLFAHTLLHTDSLRNQPSREVYERARTWAGPSSDFAKTSLDETDGFGTTGRYYWYVEHTNDADDQESYGGIMACSSSDMAVWRHEGIMVHFHNLSYAGGVPRVRVEESEVGVNLDVVEEVNFGRWAGERLFAERPIVLWNNKTETYVMWMEVHDTNKSIGVAAVATAERPSGPFEPYEAFLPDGNETEDQTVISVDGGALLVRSYYARVDYVLPSKVMQPIWESVKGADGEVDFGLNFHRANYASGYDDPNDICSQRMRREDVAFEIAVANASFIEPAEEWIKNAYTGHGQLEHFVLGEQEEPWITAEVVGLGRPEVTSRYKHPNISENNMWMPNSVPAVRAQPWSANYYDGNIADNVVHPTYMDKRIGPPEVVLKRTAKYVAISLLTEDFLNTSGVVTFIEGGLEDNKELISVALGLGFQVSSTDLPPYNRRAFPENCTGGIEDDQWESCNNATLQLQQSTMPGQVWGLDEPFKLRTEYDWRWRYHQYRTTYNDRRHAPVNFKDQLVPPFTPGRGASRSVVGRAFIREYDHNCMRGPNEYPEGHPLHVPADDLFNHPLSQTYTKSLDSEARIRSTRDHLITRGT